MVRRRRPLVDHVVRMVEHYAAVKGNLQAGAVTFFGFLSFFPIMALAFFVVGKVADVYPEAQAQLLRAIDSVLPGMVGDGEGQIPLDDVQDAAGTVGTIGGLAVIYSGLGWLSAMRDGLLVVFEMPQREQPNFFVGKLRDLVTLALIGLTLVVSVGLSGAAIGFSRQILSALDLGSELAPALVLLSVGAGLAANVVLFLTMFRLLADPHTPRRSLLQGALLGAVGFEALKLLSNYLIAATKSQPAFQAFGIALILVVWINYFSRVVMSSAAWAHTSALARQQRERRALEADRSEMAMKELAQVQLRETPSSGRGGVGPRTAFAAGGASVLGVLALLRHRRDRGS